MNNLCLKCKENPQFDSKSGFVYYGSYRTDCCLECNIKEDIEKFTSLEQFVNNKIWQLRQELAKLKLKEKV